MPRSRQTLLVVLAMTFVVALFVPAAALAGGGGGSSSGGGDLDCADFSSQEDAQATFDEDTSDPNRLDDDDDFEACEDFDYGDSETDFNDASIDAYPERGIASGGGSTANDPMSPLPLILSAGVFALLAVASPVLTLRRRLDR